MSKKSILVFFRVFIPITTQNRAFKLPNFVLNDLSEKNSIKLYPTWYRIGNKIVAIDSALPIDKQNI